MSAPSEDPQDNTTIADTSSELVVGTVSLLDALPSPVAIHSAVVGATDSVYGTAWQRLNDLNYHPVSLTAVTLPSGAIRYSSVFHKNANVDNFVSKRNLTDADYVAQLSDLHSRGYRVVDVVGHKTSSGMRYDGAWVHEITARPGYYSFRNMSLSTLQTKLTDLKAQGYRPIRLHGYPNTSGTTVYSGVWVKDALGTNYEVILDKTGSDYGTAFSQVTGNGFRCIDISSYPVGSQVRYTGVFIKDATITGAAAFRDLTLAGFEAKQREYAEANYVMVDAEHYSISASSTDARYAGVWIHRGNSNVVSNLNLTTLPAAAQTALDSLRTRLSGFQGKVGFVIEDIVTRNWIGFRINDPVYMASTAKVMIGAAVLDRAEAGDFSLGQNLTYGAADILETGDQPTVAGSYTVQQSLGWMLNASSTNATDRLVRLVTAPVINRYVEDSGIVDVGEITSICELDKRIFEFQDACARAMSCVELEQWSRNRVAPTSSSGVACVANLTRNHDASHEAYYASLANSVTPLQHARFLRRILEADILQVGNTNLMFTLMAGGPSGALTTALNTMVHEVGDKSGGKRGVKSLVGVAYNEDPAVDGLIDDTAQYAFSIFTEDWEDNYTKTEAETRLEDIAVDAFTVLNAFHPALPVEPPPPVAAEGFIESASNTAISGWARDLNFSGSISVHFYIDGQFMGSTPANLFRWDLGAHGYSWVPPKLSPGAHSVMAFAIGVNHLGQVTGHNPILANSPATYYDYDFLKPGNNGTANCSQFCEGAQWGEVGGCVGAFRTDTSERLDCFTAPGFLGDHQLSCECERGFIKPGNNGTVSCRVFCDGEQWGPVGRCVGAERTDTGERLTCDEAPGFLGDHQLTCQCVPKLILL